MRSTLLPLIAAAAVALASPIASQQLPFAVPSSDNTGVLSSIPAGHAVWSALSAPDLAALAQHIAELSETRYVRFAEGMKAVAITEGMKALLTYEGKRFIDVTDEQEWATTQVHAPFPATLAYKTAQLDPLFADISTTAMKAFLTKFTSYRTRYYRSATGAESQKFLLAHLKTIAKSNPKSHVAISEFVNPWGQNSIIVRFDAQGKNVSDQVVILGAHLDSTNLLPFLPAPGAGDDGSGTTTLVAAFTSLVNAAFVPSTHPVEFHFYSAEEGGLLGSQAIAQDYARRSIAVRSMLQMDMTSWVKTGTKPVMGVITDFVDPALTDFIRLVIGEYAEIDAVDTKCGYACSDHASWTKIGAPSAFAIESRFEDSNHNIHSTSDRIDISPEFSFDHMAQFSRMSIALAVELGGGDSLFQ